MLAPGSRAGCVVCTGARLIQDGACFGSCTSVACEGRGDCSLLVFSMLRPV